MSQIGETRSNLQTRWNSLQAQWQTTRQDWRDEMGDLFEREFWINWEEEMPKLLRAMENLEHTIEQGMRRTSEP